MAFPIDRSRIKTNLTPSSLERVIRAIEDNDVVWGETSLVGSYRKANFNIGDWHYELFEINELVNSLRVISTRPVPVGDQGRRGLTIPDRVYRPGRRRIRRRG